MEATQKLFDPRKPLGITIISGERKRCVVRWPTDAEWCQRAHAQKNFERILGRDKSMSDTPNAAKIDAALFTAIRQDTEDGPEFDAAEASAVILKLERVTRLAVDPVGTNQYELRFQIIGGLQVSHVLRTPTKLQTDDYKRASVKVLQGRQVNEIRVSLEPAAEVFKAVHVSSEGYAEGAEIPIVHQAGAVTELMAQIRAEEDAEDSPEA